MLRSVVTATLCGLAILVADLAFRTSIISHIRPVILAPAENALIEDVLQVHWDGPPQMHVRVGRIGESDRDLGVHTSPFVLSSDELGRAGGYQVALHHPRFGGWISAVRHFQYHGPSQPEIGEAVATPDDGKYLFLALEAARGARDKARGRSRDLRRENAGLRNDAARLQAKIEELYEVQEADSSHASDLENRLVELAAQLRQLGAEHSALRARVDSVPVCTAWGYVTFPRPHTIPRTRRIVQVSNLRGDIFRNQESCEVFRHDDTSSASPCFCVGDTWGG